LTRGGWRLVYTSEPSALQKSAESRQKAQDFTFSIGLGVKGEGEISSVLWNSPAFDAGIAEGTKLIAVNGLAFDGPSQLADAITQAKSGGAPIELLLRDGQHFRDVKIDYRGGLRYPHLERIPGAPDRLDDILAPLK
jgi:predicted metalloprotease with PDZ domain